MHEMFSENLRNPARERRAGAMRQLSFAQLNSMLVIPAGMYVSLIGVRQDPGLDGD